MYQIFENVFFTEGYNRTLIFDLLLKKIHFIPNEFYKIIEQKKGILIDSEDSDLLDFLKSNNLVFKSSYNIKNNFPSINYDIGIPYKFIICVIELSIKCAHNLYKFNSDMTNGRILQFNVILAEYTSLQTLDLLIDFIDKNEADTFELTFAPGFIYHDELFKLLEPINKIIIINNYTKVDIKDSSKKVNRFSNPIDPMNLHLALDLLTYFESSTNNVYFNRKIFIGQSTEIKNSSETTILAGHLEDIQELDLDLITNVKGFTEFWDVKKDDVLICSSCEFRRLCVDNRIPVKSRTTWFYNEACQYNPFINKWMHEDGYLSLEESGVFIDGDQIIIDTAKLQEINNNLWGDA